MLSIKDVIEKDWNEGDQIEVDPQTAATLVRLHPMTIWRYAREAVIAARRFPRAFVRGRWVILLRRVRDAWHLIEKPKPKARAHAT